MEGSFHRKYSLVNVLLEDQINSLKLYSPSDVVDLICKKGHKIRVHKVLLSAHSPRLKDILASQEDVNILLTDYDIAFVEKFCRLLYQGYTVVTASEAEEAKKLAAYLNFENPKVFCATKEQLLGSAELNIDKKRAKRSAGNLIPNSGHVKIRDKSEVGSDSVESNRNRKRRSRRARNEKSSLPDNASGVLQEGNTNKQGLQGSQNNVCSNSDESGSKILPLKRRKKGRYEQECNEEFAPEGLSSKSSNENEPETEESGSKSSLSSGSDFAIVHARRRLRTRRLSPNSKSCEGKGIRLRGRRRSGAPNRPGTKSARYAFGSCATDKEDARCYFCASDFDEQELANHLYNPKIPCGNHLIGEFSFKTRLCRGCRKTFSDLTHWGYIKHLHSCSLLQSRLSKKREKTLANANVNKDLIGPRQQLQVNTRHVETEQETGEIEDSLDSSDCSDGSISTDVEIFDITEVSVKAHYLPLNAALTLREEGRKKESQRIQELKARPPKPTTVTKPQSDSGTVSTEYTIKGRLGGPGPASRTGRGPCGLTVTFIRRSSQEPGKANAIASENATLVTDIEQQVQGESDQLTQPLLPEKPTATASPAPKSQALGRVKLGKIKELFRCSICYENFNDVHNATACRWGKGMQLCWICQAVFLVGEKCTQFEQFEYCNTRFRLHCSEAEHSFTFEGNTVVTCPYCGELVPIEAIHNHIESIHVRDFEIDREVKKVNRAKARAAVNMAAVIEESGPELSAVVDEAPLATEPPIHVPEPPGIASVQLPPNTSNTPHEIRIRTNTPPLLQPPVRVQQNVGINKAISVASSASLGHPKASSSTSSDVVKRSVFRYSDAKLRRMIDIVIQKIREQNRNANPGRIHKSLVEFMEEKQRLKAQNPSEFEPIQLQRVTAILEEMTSQGLLKRSTTKNAYKRNHRSEDTQQWTEKKFRKIVRHALRDLSALDSSIQGFDLDTIDDHVKHAFIIEKPPPGSNESLRQMLEKALRLEISIDNVEVVRGQGGELYRLAEEVDSTAPGENTESSNKVPGSTTTISKKNQIQTQSVPTSRVPAQKRSVSIVQQKQGTLQNSPTSAVPEIPLISKSCQEQIGGAAAIAKSKAPKTSTRPQVFSRPPPPAPKLSKSTPTSASTSVPASTSDVSGGSINSSSTRLTVGTRVNNDACKPVEPTQTKPIIAALAKGGEKELTKTGTGTRTIAPGNNREEKRQKAENIANRLLRALNKPMGPPLSQASNSTATATPPTSAIPASVPSAQPNNNPVELSRFSAATLDDPISSMRVPSPPLSSFVAGPNSTFNCVDCGMRYENMDAAMFHICL